MKKNSSGWDPMQDRPAPTCHAPDTEAVPVRAVAVIDRNGIADDLKASEKRYRFPKSAAVIMSLPCRTRPVCA